MNYESTLDEKLSWAETQDWADAMADCEQDPIWHPEGDVWTHTRLVCESLAGTPDWRALSRSAQNEAEWAAVLHDVAKPRTLARIDGRLSNPRHSIKGTRMAREILAALDAPFESRERVCGLVRHHGWPPHFDESNDPQRQVIHSSWLAPNDALFALAYADQLGRSSEDRETSMEWIRLWRLQAEELGAFRQPFPFANAHARFLFYRDALSSLHYAPREPTFTVTMTCGLPGSGKSTWLAENFDGPIVELDAIRCELRTAGSDDQGQVQQLAKERCREYLRRGESFAFDATSLDPRMRARNIRLFAGYQARIRIVHPTTSLQSSLANNATRERPVPDKAMRDMARRFEPPDWSECHDLLLVTD